MAESQLDTEKEKMVTSSVYTTNIRGRPTTEKSILFSPQPKSIVSQLLSQQKIVSADISLPLESCKPSKEFLSLCEGSTQEIEVYTCGNCSYRCENIQVYRKHVNTHKQFNCNFNDCNYTCKLLSNLIKHKRVHTNEKPYLCDICSFRTNFINSLKVHRRIHTLERPYQCKQCEYKCNSSSNLKKHCLLKHSH